MLKWIIFSILSVGLIVGLIIYSNSTKINIDLVDAYAVQVASADNGNIADHVFGKSGSAVTLIEYADFQCPGCASISPTIKLVTELYKDQLQFIFRNYPITNLHPNAKAASAATEAAGLQGKYWEMHDKIYATQSDWDGLNTTERTTFFVGLAGELSLDTSRFTADMASPSVSSKISYDQALGLKINVESTPTFFLNGTSLATTTWGNVSKLKTAIDDELKKAGIDLPQATN
jgi:protein-disulfide isomerase